MQVALTSVVVTDPVAAFQFYTQVLGFEEQIFMPEMNLAIVRSSDSSQTVGLLLEPNQHPASKAFQEAIYQEGLPCIVFGTDDINGDYERLRSKGVVFRQTPEPNEMGFQAMFEDGFGNIIQLVQIL